jgi:indole-3-glycerol phosphate synthase
MDNILDKITANKRKEVEQQKKEKTINDFVKLIGDTENKNAFKKSLIDSHSGIIAEFKRRSPSRDWIFKDAKVEDVIPLYSQNGAAAISVLTDTDFFGGTFNDLILARSLTKTPLLRKDFIVDEYQLYQAKTLGADIILLIAASLSVDQTLTFARKAKELGLEVLLEIHSEDELRHINPYVDAVGVNNRNLKSFVTNIKISFDLVNKIPNDFLKISESGISNPQSVRDLKEAGFNGFLMGENFMKTNNPGLALDEFIKQI